MSNNFTGLLKPGLVNRNYTPANMVDDYRCDFGIIEKDAQISVLSLNPGYDVEGKYVKCVANCYVPGGMSLNGFPVIPIPANKLNIWWFTDIWGNDYNDINGEDLYHAIVLKANDPDRRILTISEAGVEYQN